MSIKKKKRGCEDLVDRHVPSLEVPVKYIWRGAGLGIAYVKQTPCVVLTDCLVPPFENL